MANARGLFWTDVYVFVTDRKLGFTAAYPILDEAGELQAMVGADVMLDELSSFYGRQHVGSQGTAFNFDDAGQVIAFPDMQLATDSGGKPSLVRVAKLDAGPPRVAYGHFKASGQRRFAVDDGGQLHVASYTSFRAVPGQAWTIAVVVPEDDFIGAIERTNEVSLMISVSILGIFMLLAALIARSISRPIVRLTDDAPRIRDLQLAQNC